MKVLFNRNPYIFGKTIQQPDKELVKNTIGLFRASMEDAIKFGGDLTREALQAIQLKNNRKYVVVDTKVHLLMPGMWPSISGFHTDGVPRPTGKDKPDIRLQESEPENIYHLLVTGEGCLTQFINPAISLDLPEEPGADLYKILDKQVTQKQIECFGTENGEIFDFPIPSCQVLTWDWWHIHRATVATKHEWRFLIRVAETNTIAPLTDLREVLRFQSNVYLPQSFAW